MNTFDSRVESGKVDLDLPLLKWNDLIIANAAYLSVLVLLALFMKDREPFKPTAFMR